MPDGLSVIIGTYNQASVLEKVLPAYRMQTLTAPYELVIIDSTSSDATQTLIAQYDDLPIQYHKIKNKGKAHARNTGAKQATYNTLVITDADMIPDAGFLDAHYKAHCTAPQCYEGAAYNLQSTAWPMNTRGMSCQVSPRRMSKKLGWYYFLTGNLSLPTALFQAYQFSEDFTGYGWEDLELGYRLHQDNYPLYFLPTAINYHFHVVDKMTALDRDYQKGCGARIFLDKHPELKWFLGLHPLGRWVSQVPQSGKLYQTAYAWATQSRIPWCRRLGEYAVTEWHYLQGVYGTPVL